MAPVIKFENVSKRYRLGSGRGSLREAIPNLFGRLVGRSNNPDGDAEYIWALKDVSFEVGKGEALGIIGPNGAGKTTILKLLAGITKPTKGSISIQGRMASLIELGAGFHPDLTGRENVYLNGAIMGLSRKEIDEKLDSIVEFAELEEFIDTPVKRYSSGMYARLGFSVAAHVDPDILLVDEVLAVGDMSFQRKCLDKMNEFRRQGKTIVFISHNMHAIQAVCDKGIWLDRGKVNSYGEIGQVVAKYISKMDERVTQLEQGRVLVDARGSGEVQITKVSLLNGQGKETSFFEVGERLGIKVNFRALKRVSQPNFGVSIWTDDGMRVCSVNTKFDNHVIDSLQGDGFIVCVFESLPLVPGRYYLRVGVYDSNNAMPYDLWGWGKGQTLVVIKARMVGSGKTVLSREHGIIYLPATWTRVGNN